MLHSGPSRLSILYITVYVNPVSQFIPPSPWVSIHLFSATAAKSLQSCPTLCDPIDGSPPGSPVSGILQARTLEWAAISFSNAWKCKVKGKSYPTLSDPMDCSLPGSFVHRIFQARVLEWGAIAFSNICSLCLSISVLQITSFIPFLLPEVWAFADFPCSYILKE